MIILGPDMPWTVLPSLSGNTRTNEDRSHSLNPNSSIPFVSFTHTLSVGFQTVESTFTRVKYLGRLAEASPFNSKDIFLQLVAPVLANHSQKSRLYRVIVCLDYFTLHVESYVGRQRIQHHLPRGLLLSIYICIGKWEGSKHISKHWNGKSILRQSCICAE